MAIGSADGGSLGGTPGRCYAHQIAASDDEIGRIELDPTGAGHIDVCPRVGCAAAAEARSLVSFVARIVEIARDEARSEAQPARNLHIEEGKISAGARARENGLGRRLDAFGFPSRILKAFMDGAAEQV